MKKPIERVHWMDYYVPAMKNQTVYAELESILNELHDYVTSHGDEFPNRTPAPLYAGRVSELQDGDAIFGSKPHFFFFLYKGSNKYPTEIEELQDQTLLAKCKAFTDKHCDLFTVNN